MHTEGVVEIARFEQGDEVRTVGIAGRSEGGAHIFQLSSGPLTELAYGEPAVCHRLTLEDEGLRLLMGMLGGEYGVADALARFFSCGDAVLADLVDICDRAGIAWTLCSMGTSAGTIARAHPIDDGGWRPSPAP